MTGLLQFASNAPGERMLDHEFRDTIGDYWAHGGCVALVMRGGGGDQCGRSYKAHSWAPWVFHGQRYRSADPAGQDFDFHPVYDAPPSNNPVNRILVSFRENSQAPHVFLQEFALDIWLAALDSYDVFGGYPSWDDENHPYHSIIEATGMERIHARTVLERLKAFAEVTA